MAILKQKINFDDHRAAIQASLWRRDAELLAEHHGQLYEHIERAIEAGISPDIIRRWAASEVSEWTVVQRCYNAARWIKGEND